MRISIMQENLNKGLFIVSHIATQHTTLPILQSVLFEAKNGSLFLKATDLEIGASVIIRGKIEKDGSCAVDAKLISNYINLLKNDRVDIELKDGKLVISCCDQIGKISILEHEEYPTIPTIEKNKSYVTDIKSFKKAMSDVVFSASSDSSRPELNGVFMMFEKDKLTLAGTDSYRLSEKKIRIDSKTEAEAKFILPIKTARELVRTITETDGEIKIFTEETQVGFFYEDVELVTRVVDGEYPDYKNIIPSTKKASAIVPKEDLVRAVKSASLFTTQSNTSVVIDIKKDSETEEVVVSTVATAVGENKSSIKARIDGEGESVVLNCRYLIEGVQNIEGDEIVMEVTDSFAPVVIRSIYEKSNYLYLIMPIRQ